MSDSPKELRDRVELRLGPLAKIEAPSTAEEAAQLARTDSDLFDALFEAGRIGPDALGAKGGDDGEGN